MLQGGSDGTDVRGLSKQYPISRLAAQRKNRPIHGHSRKLRARARFGHKAYEILDCFNPRIISRHHAQAHSLALAQYFQSRRAQHIRGVLAAYLSRCALCVRGVGGACLIVFVSHGAIALARLSLAPAMCLHRCATLCAIIRIIGR